MADTARFMSTEFLPSFISVYRNHPCLWYLKSKDYFDKALKTAAYKELIQLTKKIIPSCDLNFVKRKIEVLRGSFRRERRKVKNATKPGSGRNPKYKPKLWYYDMLMFLKDEGERRPIRRMWLAPVDADPLAQDVQEVETFTEDEEDENVTFEIEAKYTPNTDTSMTTYTSLPHEQTKCESEEAAAAAPLPDVPFLNHRQEDEFDKFGAVVAAKLRRMAPVQEIFAENLINQVLFSGMLGRLQESSTIVSHEPKHFIG